MHLLDNIGHPFVAHLKSVRHVAGSVHVTAPPETGFLHGDGVGDHAPNGGRGGRVQPADEEKGRVLKIPDAAEALKIRIGHRA